MNTSKHNNGRINIHFINQWGEMKSVLAHLASNPACIGETCTSAACGCRGRLRAAYRRPKESTLVQYLSLFVSIKWFRSAMISIPVKSLGYAPPRQQHDVHCKWLFSPDSLQFTKHTVSVCFASGLFDQLGCRQLSMLIQARCNSCTNTTCARPCTSSSKAARKGRGGNYSKISLAQSSDS